MSPASLMANKQVSGVKRWLLNGGVGVWLSLLPSLLQANVIINMTRVIYPADAREVTVPLSNPGNEPALIQAWIDEGDPNSRPDRTQAPFILLPPIFRLDPGLAQGIRLSFTHTKTLPTDQESLFWLNILDIPPKPQNAVKNYLQMAIRSRIKLFYRPATLDANVAQAPKALQASIVTGDPMHLRINNPSPFHITLTEVALEAGHERLPLENGMVAPKSELLLTIPTPIKTGPLRLTFKNIDDYGAQRPQQLAVAR